MFCNDPEVYPIIYYTVHRVNASVLQKEHRLQWQTGCHLIVVSPTSSEQRIVLRCSHNGPTDCFLPALLVGHAVCESSQCWMQPGRWQVRMGNMSVSERIVIAPSIGLVLRVIGLGFTSLRFDT